MNFCSRMAVTLSLVVACASCVAPDSRRELLYPTGWSKPESEEDVTSLFAHAKVMCWPYRDQFEPTLFETERRWCQSQGRELVVTGDERLLKSGDDFWIYRNASGWVLFDRHFRANVDKGLCTARITEVRGVEICDVKKEHSDCADSGQWPVPFSFGNELINGRDASTAQVSKTIVGVPAVCASNGDGFVAEGVCVASKSGPVKGMVLSYDFFTDDASSCGNVKVDRVLSRAKVDSAIFTEAQSWKSAH